MLGVLCMNELAEFVNEFLNDNGIKKTWVAKQLGTTQQLLYKRLNKKNFTSSDANEILGTIGYKLDYKIVRADGEKKK